MEEKGKREKKKVRERVRGKEGKKKSSLARKEKKLSLSLFATRKNEKIPTEDSSDAHDDHDFESLLIAKEEGF